MKVWPSTMWRLVAVPSSLVPSLAAADRKTLDEAISMMLPITLRRKGILYDAGNQKREQPYPLDRIEAPTLMITAQDDLYETLPNARAAQSKIPGSRLIFFESGGHLLLGHDAEVSSAVADFISRQPCEQARILCAILAPSPM
jgi:pimeloyl-ACP methyl ester carboxylesterase